MLAVVVTWFGAFGGEIVLQIHSVLSVRISCLLLITYGSMAYIILLQVGRYQNFDRSMGHLK